MTDSSFTIETPRLILRQWTENDAGDLYRYASDSRVSSMALWPRHTSVDMSRNVIKEYFIPNRTNFAVALKDSGEVIGCIGLVPPGDEHYTTLPHEREIGYWIGLPLWGNSYATEALQALIQFCRNTLHLQSVILTIDARNTASRKVAGKCGFSPIGEYLLDGVTTLAFRLILS